MCSTRRSLRCPASNVPNHAPEMFVEGLQPATKASSNTTISWGKRVSFICSVLFVLTWAKPLASIFANGGGLIGGLVAVSFFEFNECSEFYRADAGTGFNR